MLGFLPAPYIYGKIFEATKKTKPKLGMALSFYYTLIGTSLILIGMILRYKEFKDMEQREKEIQEEFERKKIEEKDKEKDLILNSPPRAKSASKLMKEEEEGKEEESNKDQGDQEENEESKVKVKRLFNILV